MEQLDIFDLENKKRLRVLVACEESQAVCIAFRELGHDAYSCDIQDCSGGHPEWHIKDDVLNHLDEGWDLVIAHPPCTYLSKAGSRWLYKNGSLNQERYKKGLDAKEFFMRFLECSAPMICVENPMPNLIYNFPKPGCIIQPYEFGHPYTKKTYLWLKNLPPLIPTELLAFYKPFMPSNTGGKKKGQKYSHGVAHTTKGASKTFTGIARAMAEQWGGKVI